MTSCKPSHPTRQIVLQSPAVLPMRRHFNIRYNQAMRWLLQLIQPCLSITHNNPLKPWSIRQTRTAFATLSQSSTQRQVFAYPLPLLHPQDVYPPPLLPLDDPTCNLQPYYITLTSLLKTIRRYIIHFSVICLWAFSSFQCGVTVFSFYFFGSIEGLFCCLIVFFWSSCLLWECPLLYSFSLLLFFLDTLRGFFFLLPLLNPLYSSLPVISFWSHCFWLLWDFPNFSSGFNFSL